MIQLEIRVRSARVQVLQNLLDRMRNLIEARDLDPKLTMDPTLIGPPDIQLPNVNMAQYGDPLGGFKPPYKMKI